MGRPLFIVGAGEFAEVAHYYFTKDQGRQVTGFAVDDAYHKSGTVCGMPCLTLSEAVARFPCADHDAFVAIGYSDLNRARVAKAADMERRGYHLASFLHSRAIVWDDFELEPNTFILEHNSIQPFTSVGRDAVLWSGNHIGHHCTIEDGCFITSHVVIAGGVTLGRESFVGINSSIRDHVRVGARNIIGAGSLIVADTPDDSVFSGLQAERSPVPSHRVRRL
jgi:sugar O-acyltransferase (sialic acid O-acetyltransferase NeuD family)